MSAKPQSSKRLLIMAGGTGGHIFPALAIAQALIKQGWEIRWLGTADRMEATLVPQYNIDIDFINISGVRGKGIQSLLASPFRIARATKQAKNIINAYKPHAILGMGGYVSGPGGVAAKLLGVPIVLHEQNSIAGLTNKYLAKIATVVMTAFPNVLPNAAVVGNPLRDDILAIAEPNRRFAERSGPIRVLVIGGSQGARVLNQTLPAMVKAMGDKITVWHQVGKNDIDTVKQAYGDEAKQHQIVPFIDDMASAYAWADIIICRSGALTVSEVEMVGLAAIFVPFQHKDRQQYWNAKPLEQIGAAYIIEQEMLSNEALTTILSSLDRAELLTMANRARTLAKPNATKLICEAIESVTMQK